LKETKNLPVEFRYRCFECLATGIDDNGPLGAQLIQMEADRLPDAPLDAIAHNGLTNRARQSEADVGTRRLGFADTECREQRTRNADPLVVYPSKILRSEDADTFRKAWD
jgi:hypothetical protein